MKKREDFRGAASEPNQANHEQLKERTVIALDKLGHQKFSSEPGGYSLENWMKGVNLLLDDFERELGEDRLPTGYSERRRQLTDYLLKPVDTSSIDGRLSELKQRQAEVMGEIKEKRRQVSSKLDVLQDELARRSAELEQAKSHAADGAASEPPRSRLGRLFGRSQTSSAKAVQARVDGAERRFQTVSEEIAEQRKLLKSIDQRSPKSPLAAEWTALESIEARTAELEGERLEKVQLVREREEVAASMADMISKISLGQ